MSEERNAEEVLHVLSDEVRVPVEDGGGGTPVIQAQASWNVVKLEGDATSLCGLGHQKVKSVGVAQVDMKC